MPEIRYDWYLNEIDTISTRDIDRFQPLSPAERAELETLIPYWEGKSVNESGNSTMPDGLWEKFEGIIGGGCSLNNHYFGHHSVDYTVILDNGAEELIKQLDEKIASADFCDPQQMHMRTNWQAMKISLEAIVILANRYADEAERLAGIESDAGRRDELLQIARICRKVPAKPASTFEEAVQCIWFTFIALINEAWGNAVGFMRIDQYLYPYFKRDMDAGILTKARAYELIAMIMIKTNESVILYGKEAAANMAGFCIGSNFVIGGCDGSGKCAVNDLSYIILDAEEDVALNSEEIVIRVSEDTPDSFLLRCCEIAKKLCGKFKFIGDKTAISQMLVDGRTLEQARDYVVIGCTSPSVPGQSMDWLHSSLNAAMVLEMTFNDGISPISHLQAGPHTGRAEDFTSYEQLWEAYKTQLIYTRNVARLRGNIEVENDAKMSPNPFQSLLCPICFERGVDIIEGGTAPNITIALSVGAIPNAADSLAAIKKYVFEEKKFSMAKLMDACRSDFIGYEDILDMLKKAPKFGNDDDYVDGIVEQIIDVLDETPPEHNYIFGAKPTVAAAIVTGNVPLGKLLGAQPDGRRAGTPLSEGGLSPHQGRNISGVTATLKSIAKLDHDKLRHGSVLNLRFDPDTVKSADKMLKLSQLIRVYFSLGGFLVQFNFVSTDTLKDAKLNPEKYRDLVVRVATYSAYFVELSEDMQNDIIARYEQKDL